MAEQEHMAETAELIVDTVEAVVYMLAILSNPDAANIISAMRNNLMVFFSEEATIAEKRVAQTRLAQLRHQLFANGESIISA